MSEQEGFIPEILNDEFYNAIVDVVIEKGPKTILEIGSANGLGSTQAFIEGCELCDRKPELFCTEPIIERFNELVRNTGKYGFVNRYNVSSVNICEYMSEERVDDLMAIDKLKTTLYPVQLVLDWRTKEIEYIAKNTIQQDGIDLIRRENGIDTFDVVLIDGSPFTADAEINKIYGAGVIMLDDTMDIKCWNVYNRLLKDDMYELVRENKDLRNGFAIFERVYYEWPML
jgi:predicted O-methyltransferase YrrM